MFDSKAICIKLEIAIVTLKTHNVVTKSYALQKKVLCQAIEDTVTKLAP